MINRYRLCCVLAENFPLADGSGFDGLLVDGTHTLSSRRSTSIEDAVGLLIKALGGLSPLGGRRIVVISCRESAGRLEGSTTGRRSRLRCRKRSAAAESTAESTCP